MTELVPNRFLVDVEFPLRYRSAPPQIDGDLSDWSDAELLPYFGELDEEVAFADLWACWHESGLYFACHVTGKWSRLRCDPKHFRSGDNLRICTDMRDTRGNKRATRFCQQFYFLPTGGKKNAAIAGTSTFRMAREDAPSVSARRLRVASRITAKGYSLEAHVPADCLNGFDPAEHPRIGLFYILEDDDYGQQSLTIGDELNWFQDPSTWATAMLVP